MTAVFVGIGAMAGGLLRYGLTVWVQSLWTIAAINIVGSFLLGLLTHLSAPLRPELQHALGAGLLGGFTTFSTFTVQTLLEADVGRTGRAVAYVLISVLGGLVAAAAGYLLGRVLSA